MMQRAMTVALLGAMGLVAVQAQTPAPGTPPATTPQAPAGRGGGRGGPPLVTPEVKVDNTVTFRFRAPNAAAGHADRRTRWQDLSDDQG